MIAVDGIRERYRVVAGEADVAVSLPIHDFSVEARWIRIESDHGIQAVFGQFRRTQDTSGSPDTGTVFFADSRTFRWEMRSISL